MSGLFAVLMAGGAGTRFWPASRHARPKQLLPIAGGEPLLVRTSRRLLPVAPPERQLVVTASHLVPDVRRLLPELPAEHVVGEPVGRDTAACVGLASLIVERLDPAATVVAVPADQLVQPEALFCEHLRAAEAALAEHPGRLLVFGVEATRPETGYGWLERGEALGRFAGRAVYALERFVEKPPLETARALLASGKHAWNAGLFAFRPAAMRAAFDAHLPELLPGLQRCADAYRSARFQAVLADEYPRLRKVSIDYGVMERVRDALLLPLPVSWDDVGSWTALERQRPADAAGNVSDGEVLALGAQRNVLVAAAGGLVTVAGVDDLIVVHTPDVTLVCKRSDDQAVKTLVDELRRRGLERYL